MTNFVHLRLHSEFSLKNSILSVGSVVDNAVSNEMAAVAITDHMNLFAAVKFYKKAISKGVKPIFGADVFFEDGSSLLLLVKNREGYVNLNKIISKAYYSAEVAAEAVVNESVISEHSNGLICLSGGIRGDVGRLLLSGDVDEAKELAKKWLDVFSGEYYIELMRTEKQHEDDYNQKAVNLASDLDIPTVATNDVLFSNPVDFDAHEVRVCINEGFIVSDPRREKKYTKEQYFKTPYEMDELFSDIPTALSNTVEIAKKCNLDFVLGVPELPDFPVPEGMTVDDFLREESHKGLLARFEQDSIKEEDKESYKERLDTELDVIIGMGFPGYFLIVADFIQWSKDNGIPVGPGRGSGAGSLVAYALKITDLDPIPYNLLFERFLNPERVSMPDFDIDFCTDGRDKVIGYVSERYGKEKVSQIITYGTMAAKAVVRDVSRVMGQSYSFGDRIAKLIPFEPGMTLKKAFEMNADLRKLYEDDSEVREVIDMSRQLEGLSRNAGKHAGGVVIGRSDLTEYCPLYLESKDATAVTQFDKDDAEQVGLVKFDFLGLRNLTVIDKAIKNIKKSQNVDIDILSIPLDDAKTFEQLQKGNTTAVFQLESSGMKDLIKRLKPSCFEDIVALVALYRPGPLGSGMVDDFVARKHGLQEISYPHEMLEEILSPTYGTVLYQEQVMQIAQTMAGYTLGGADLLRRAMGKKKPEEMKKQRAIFVTGSTENGVEEKTATHIFDIMEKFAEYGFNKSHSAAYALVSYQTSWLKTHYPLEFMAAVLSSDMDNTDKVVTFLDDCEDNKITVTRPNINVSNYDFAVDDNKIIYGFGAIKGVGEAAIESIVATRSNDGKFKDIFDFASRVDLKKVNKRTNEALIYSGAMDVFDVERSMLIGNLEVITKASVKLAQDKAIGQNDMFSTGSVDSKTIKLDEFDAWDDDERLKNEKKVLGLYITGHPISKHVAEISMMTTRRVKDLVSEDVKMETYTNKNDEEVRRSERKRVLIAGMIHDLRKKISKNGNQMAFFALDDKTARIDTAVFSRTFDIYKDQLIDDNIVVVDGELTYDEYSDANRLEVKSLYSMDEARNKFARYLSIDVTEESEVDEKTDKLEKIIIGNSGYCPVILKMKSEDKLFNMRLGNSYLVDINQECINSLKAVYGENKVSVIYSEL